MGTLDGRGDGTQRVVVTVTSAGWGTGWLFTIGFAHLGFAKGLLALLLWPYLLGGALGGGG